MLHVWWISPALHARVGRSQRGGNPARIRDSKACLVTDVAIGGNGLCNVFLSAQEDCSLVGPAACHILLGVAPTCTVSELDGSRVAVSFW